MSDDFLGLNVKDFAIGLQGAFSGIFILRKNKLRDVVGTVFVGAVTANYLGPWVADHSMLSHNLAVYFSGLGGWTICFIGLKILDQKLTERLKG